MPIAKSEMRHVGSSMATSEKEAMLCIPKCERSRAGVERKRLRLWAPRSKEGTTAHTSLPSTVHHAPLAPYDRYPESEMQHISPTLSRRHRKYIPYVQRRHSDDKIARTCLVGNCRSRM